jgi:hypothetical protein
MKVKCVGFADHSRNKLEIESWMAIGSIHSVIAINCYKKGLISYGLFIGDIRKEWPSVVEFPADVFEIVDGSLPRIWRAFITESVFSLWPKTWDTLEVQKGIVDKDPRYWSVFADAIRDIIGENADEM